MMDDDDYDEDCDRLRDYLKLIERKQMNDFFKTSSFDIRLSFDDVDKRCRRVPNDAPEIVPLSTIKGCKTKCFLHNQDDNYLMEWILTRN